MNYRNTILDWFHQSIRKKNFSDLYHAILHRENGLGRSDLLLLSAPYEGNAVVMELKVADSFAKLEDCARGALRQIKDKQYDAELMLDGYHTFIYYGIAFYKKLYKVTVE